MTSVVRLDEPALVQAALAKDLPSEHDKAAQLVRQRLLSDGAQLTSRLSAAYQGLVEAWNLGIRKLPAVVVDGRYVVYGDSNVAHALALIRQHRGANP